MELFKNEPVADDHVLDIGTEEDYQQAKDRMSLFGADRV